MTSLDTRIYLPLKISPPSIVNSQSENTISPDVVHNLVALAAAEDPYTKKPIKAPEPPKKSTFKSIFDLMPEADESANGKQITKKFTLEERNIIYQLKGLFFVNDLDNDGYLMRSELITILHQVGIPITEKLLNKYIPFTFSINNKSTNQSTTNTNNPNNKKASNGHTS